MLLLQTVHSSGSARNDTIKRGHCIEVVESRTIGMVYDPEDTSGTGSREYVRLRFYRSYVFAVMSIPVTIALDIFPQRSSAMDYTHSQANQLLANAEFLEPLAHAEAAFSRLAPVKHHDRRVDLQVWGRIPPARWAAWPRWRTSTPAHLTCAQRCSSCRPSSCDSCCC